MNFLWHDYETFGVDAKRDRPSQFGAIRTDENLVEIPESACNWHCQPSPDVLLNPTAVHLTGITPWFAEEHGMPEHEFAEAVLNEMSVPGTCAVGYNSFHFDDEVSRHLFWRNLLPVYDREWRNGNSRWDLLPVMRACYAIDRRPVWTWPTRDGQVSFKLEDLVDANGLLARDGNRDTRAHDAVGDVRGLIALAQRLKTNNPGLWNYALSLLDKTTCQERASVPCWFVSGHVGKEHGGITLVHPVGRHPTNKNSWIVWDCRKDINVLFDESAENLRAALWDGDVAARQRVGLIEIKTNQAPWLMTVEQWKGWGASEQAFNLPVAALKERSAALSMRLAAASADMATKIAHVYQAAQEPSTDADVGLYNGFLNGTETAYLKTIRSASSGHREGGAPSALTNNLALRYLARKWGVESLNNQDRQAWVDHLRSRWVDGEKGYRTMSTVLELCGDDLALAAWVKQHADQQARAAGWVLPPEGWATIERCERAGGGPRP